jgi:hypothetical protein
MYSPARSGQTHKLLLGEQDCSNKNNSGLHSICRNKHYESRNRPYLCCLLGCYDNILAAAAWVVAAEAALFAKCGRASQPATPH